MPPATVPALLRQITPPGRDPATDPGVSAFIHFENGIRAFVNANERAHSIALGKELLDKELRRYKLSLKSWQEDGRLQEALKKLGYRELDELHAPAGPAN